MVQCFLEMSLSSVWRFGEDFQGPGRRWPKKKPSGSDSEEEEQVGQGLCSWAFPGVLGRSRPCPLDAPLGVSRVELATVEGSVTWEVILSSEEAPFQPTLGSGSVSPVRNAHLRAPKSLCKRRARVACSLPPRPRLVPCAPPLPPVYPKGPRLRPPVGDRVPSPGASLAPQPRREGSGGLRSAQARDAR